MFSHEASIIASKERAEMKTIEFFIPRKLSLTAQIFNHTAPCAVKHTGFVADMTYQAIPIHQAEFFPIKFSKIVLGGTAASPPPRVGGGDLALPYGDACYAT